MHDVYINSFGCFLPGEPIPNSHMEDHLGLIGGQPSRSRALVLRQNRIKTRHYAIDATGKAQYTNLDMANRAIRDAIEKSEVSLEDIRYLATSTTIGDVMLPGLASHVHAALGIKPIEVASFQSVCASSLMALKSAYLQVKSGEHACAAVSGSEFASRYFRPGFYEHTDAYKQTGEVPFNADFLRFTLSDGAGAAILENKPNARQLSFKIKWVDIRSFADRFDMCMVGGAIKENGEWRYWGDYESPIAAARGGALMLTQDFDLIKQMIPVWMSHYLALIEQGKVSIDQIDHVCCHYSSQSLREETISHLIKAGVMVDEEKWFSNLSTKGNTGAASIFILLEEFYRSGRVKKGDTILCQVPESGRSISGFMLLEAV
jgi:3-oxoacyl-[acyl-carrier-protein] synthase-3